MSAISPPSTPANRPSHSLETAVAHIDAAAIAHNLEWLRQKLNPAGHRPAPPIWAVAKADAYGHTLAPTLAGLAHADGIAMLSLADAYQCRSMGWHKPILAMSAEFTAADLRDPVLFPLHLVIDSGHQLDELERLPAGSPLHVWLRYSGSLHHAGFHNEEYGPAYRRLQRLLQTGRLAGIGHLQHYAHAEDIMHLRAERQAFHDLLAGLPGAQCTENSAALLLDPGYACGTDWVRSGLALYGISPLPDISGPALGLKPAMALLAPLHKIQLLRAGSPLGYGAAFRAGRDMRVGLVRCGYADGYPRSIGNDCAVLIDGRRSPIIGRVSMDTLTIDLSAHPHAAPGTLATLWGTGDLPIEAIARSAGTIPAQLCTGLTARVPRLAIPSAGRTP
jgi:alanine racemase